MINPALCRAINQLGAERKPFILSLSFSGCEHYLWELDRLPEGVKVAFPSFKHGAEHSESLTRFSRVFPDYSRYKKGFEDVQYHLHRGDSYLTNLTGKSEVQSNLSLGQLFDVAVAKYKFHIPDAFTFFSPETFVTIADGVIATHPMKGTIDAALPDAAARILSDPKELAEHATIVDLLRNDLSIVATEVAVPRFRYLEELKTSHTHLLQVSSEIIGRLAEGWQGRLGTILSALLPAGSVSGAPKAATCDIIAAAEEEGRGFYTGITLLFGGETVDSCVNIRYVEESGGCLYYRSGGGITHQSNCESEYRELTEKVYVPIG